MATALEGVRVGPLDPDKTETFGQATNANARRLIRLHAQAMPPELQRALSKKLDEPRTTAVVRNMGEVADYLAGLELENGDPVIPAGAELEGAQVRGEPGTKQVLTFTYRVASGRSAKWFVPYVGDDLPAAHEMGTELTRIARAKEVGVVAWDDQGHSKQALDRENASLRRQVTALRQTIEKGTGEVPDGPMPEGRADEALLSELEELRKRDVERGSRLAQIEAALAAVPGGADALLRSAGTPQTIVAEEPYEGYDESNSQDVISHLRDEGTSQDERQAVLDYERSHANRKTVVAAAETTLDQNRE